MQHHPADPRDDHGQQDQAATKRRYRRRTSGSRAREDRPDLQADEDEREDVQDEDRGVPHRVRRERASAPASAPAPAARPKMAKQTIVRTLERPSRSARIQTPNVADELEDDRRRHVLDCAREPQHQPRRATGPTTMLPTTTSSSVGRQAPDRERLHRHRADGQPVDQQRARVVQEALALEDRQDAMRRPQLPQHRHRRRGVGRRHDRARARPPPPTASPGTSIRARRTRPRTSSAPRSRPRGSPPAPSSP